MSSRTTLRETHMYHMEDSSKTVKFHGYSEQGDNKTAFCARFLSETFQYSNTTLHLRLHAVLC